MFRRKTSTFLIAQQLWSLWPAYFNQLQKISYEVTVHGKGSIMQSLLPKKSDSAKIAIKELYLRHIFHYHVLIFFSCPLSAHNLPTICACKICVIILIKLSKWNLSHYLQHWSHTMTPIKASSSPSSLLTITICQRYKNQVRFRVFQFKSAFLWLLSCI